LSKKPVAAYPSALFLPINLIQTFHLESHPDLKYQGPPRFCNCFEENSPFLQTSSQTTIYSRSIHDNMDTFTSLPPEIRNMIYSLLLIQGSPIPICSPRRWVMNEHSTTPTASFHNLMLVNKQIHAEVYTAFYSYNTFSIGNGDYGSSRETNMHGLKSFIRRVPAQYIHYISKLTILTYLRKMYSTPAPSLGPFTYIMKYGICTITDAKDIQVITRAVVKHFKGVKVLSLEPCIGGPERQHDDEPRVCRERSVDEIAEAVKILLKHPKLEKLNVVRRDDLSQLQEAVEMAFAETKSKVAAQIGTNIIFKPDL
jgi:hypothetical protein